MQAQSTSALITQWLEESRSAAAAGLRAKGVPPAFDVQIRVVTDATEGGFSTSSRTVRVSPFAANAPGLMSVFGDLDFKEPPSPAADLYRAYGPKCEVWNPLTRARFDEDPVRWIDEVFLSRLLRKYLSRLRSLAEPDSQLASGLAGQLVRLFEGDVFRSETIIPIGGLRLLSSELGAGPVLLRSLTGEELGQLTDDPVDRLLTAELALPRLARPHAFLTERAALILHEDHPKNSQFRLGSLMHRALLALQLHGFAPHGRGFAITRTLPVSLYGTTGTPLVLPERGEWHDLGPGDLVEALALADLIPDDAVADPRDRRSIALHRFRLGCADASPADAVVDFVVALEGLLLPAAQEGELRFRFGYYGAWYLASGPAERVDVMKRLIGVYDTRSELVHGTVARRDDLAQVAEDARVLAARGLAKGLRGGWPSQGFLRSLALGTTPNRSGTSADMPRV